MVKYLAIITLIITVSIYGKKMQENEQKSTKFIILGYQPSWHGKVAESALPMLTHLNYCFVLPNADGSLQEMPNPQLLKKIRMQTHKYKIKLCLAVGGWNDGNDSNFEKIACSAKARSHFIKELLIMVNKYNLDGVDLDWEYPDPGQSAKNFLLLAKELSIALHKADKLCTIAVVKYGKQGEGIPKEAFQYFDFVNIMAYDGKNHGLYHDAEKSLNYWLKRGLPAKKAVLGTPFYSRPNYKPYNQIIAKNPKLTQVDKVGNDTFCGVRTTRKKVELAKKSAAGIMFWELSQDSNDDNSLLKAIYNQSILPAKNLKKQP